MIRKEDDGAKNKYFVCTKICDEDKKIEVIEECICQQKLEERGRSVCYFTCVNGN